MLDSSRHFLPVKEIKKMIDGLMFNKMNILHWHISDEDSFPLEVKTQPELSQYGSVGGTYSETDVKSLIQYAKTRGVRLIPEIDTPAHTQSWGRSEALAEIIVNCNTEYKGQFDPTLNKTYDVVKNVM
jgi:hexosaminidase